MSAHWLGVAAAEHVRRGRAGGFVQLCHGKAAPLRRVGPGHRIVYYSPTVSFGGRDRLQAFTAIGTVGEAEPYRVDMSGDFRPYRRDVAWDDAEETPIRPLLEELSFTAGRPNWGYALRFGLLAIPPHDFERIAAAMKARR